MDNKEIMHRYVFKDKRISAIRFISMVQSSIDDFDFISEYTHTPIEAVKLIFEYMLNGTASETLDGSYYNYACPFTKSRMTREIRSLIILIDASNPVNKFDNFDRLDKFLAMLSVAEYVVRYSAQIA